MWLVVYIKLNKSYKKLDVNLKRRLELLSMYLEMIYDSFLQEQAALIAINSIKDKLKESLDVNEYFEINARLSEELQRIFNSVLNYPELRNKENFDSVHNELNELEKSIDTNRKIYNGCANKFNLRMSKFPFKIFKSKERSLYVTKYDRFNS